MRLDRFDLSRRNWDGPIANQNAFERFGGRLELLLDRGVVEASVVLRHVQGSVSEQLAHGLDGQAMVDELGGEGVAQLMRGDLYATELAPPAQLIAYRFIGEQFAVVEPQMIIGVAGRCSR